MLMKCKNVGFPRFFKNQYFQKTKKKPSKSAGFLRKTLVRAKGLEPSTSTLARLRSSQLSYARTAVCILTYIFMQCKYFLSRFLILCRNNGIPRKLATCQVQLFLENFQFVFFLFVEIVKLGPNTKGMHCFVS